MLDIHISRILARGQFKHLKQKLTTFLEMIVTKQNPRKNLPHVSLNFFLLRLYNLLIEKKNVNPPFVGP